MTKKPGPTYDQPNAEPGSVQEPDGAEWPIDEAFEDAFLERNREQIGKLLAEALQDFEAGRVVSLEDALAEMREHVRSLGDKS
jgi:hypothetical protein